MHDLCCIGHITLDKIVTPKNTVHMAGGTAFYFSHAIKHFNDIDYSLITALAESEMKVTIGRNRCGGYAQQTFRLFREHLRREPG